MVRPTRIGLALALVLAASPLPGRVPPPVEPDPPSRRASELFPEQLRAECEEAVGRLLPGPLPELPPAPPPAPGSPPWFMPPGPPRGPWVVRTRVGGCPDDWHSFDSGAGFCVEAACGEHFLRVWFLPRDWVAIRKPDNRACRTCYWAGIFKSEHFTVVTHASADALHEAAHKMPGACTASLCNGGRETAEATFAQRKPAADRAASRLVARHCRTGLELGEAANSLIELGVPARSVMLKALAEVKPGEMRHGLGFDGIYSVLGREGDLVAIDALCERLRQVPSKYIVYALAPHRDRAIGPALHAALKIASHEDLEVIAADLGRRRYRPAAPDIAAAFAALDGREYAAPKFAHALASLDYRPAIPLIERAAARCPEGSPMRMAFTRLTGDWGAPGLYSRDHVEAPARVKLGEPAPVTITLELTGDEPVSTLTLRGLHYGLTLDGAPVAERPRFGMGGLHTYLVAGDLYAETFDLGPFLKPGIHTVRLGDGKSRGSSNAVEIEVVP